MMDNIKDLKDEELVQLICNEDQEQYRELIRRYQDRLLKYAYYLINNREDAHDAVQEAFIKAFINLRGFDTKKKFSSWIYRIVHNESINIIKKKKYIVPKDYQELERMEDTDVDIEKQAEKEEMTSMLTQYLDQLPVNYKECLILYYLEEKSYEEISEILQKPIGTISTNISRGKKLIKEILINKGIKP